MDWTNKVVLVTGGTGFIGQRIVRYVLDTYPIRKVISFSRRWSDSERLLRDMNDPRLRAINGDVCDLGALQSALREVDLVVHSAAYKNVPLAEYNGFEATRVNVFGSMNVITACIDQGVSKCLFVSSDKACDPINLYGANKRNGEALFASANNLSKTRFATARYGNIVNSTGSVVPYFHSLLQNGKDELPVTDPHMTRYWFSPQNAVQYVLRCLCEMQGGETFVPKLKSSTIDDLVRAFQIAYADRDRDIRMKIVGRRPGEKSHESMISSNEVHRTYDREWTYVIEPERRDWDANYVQTGIRVADDFVDDSYRAKRYEINGLVQLIKE